LLWRVNKFKSKTLAISIILADGILQQLFAAVCRYDAVAVVCGAWVNAQVKARNASSDVIYKTRQVNMSRVAASDACDILPSALPSGQ